MQICRQSFQTIFNDTRNPVVSLEKEEKKEEFVRQRKALIDYLLD
jgi:hypothetical protein